MKVSVSEKCKHIVHLIKAVRTVGLIVPGAKVLMPDKRPAAYVGLMMDSSIQMYAFRLFDGTEVVLEVPALNQKTGQVDLLVTREVADRHPANK